MKKKNRPINRIPIIIFALVVGFIIIIVLVANMIETSTRQTNLVATVTAFIADSTGTQQSRYESGTQVVQANMTELAPTIEYEETAIAEMRANPTLALTPFNIEMAFNIAMRQHTATPSKRSDNCYLIADYFHLSESVNDIESYLLKSDSDAFVKEEFYSFVRVSTAGVWGATEFCDQFQPVYTSITVWAETDLDQDSVEDDTKLIFEAIASNFDGFEYLTPIEANIEVTIVYTDDESYLKANWQQIQDALSQDGDLITSLGGLRQAEPQQEVIEE